MKPFLFALTLFLFTNSADAQTMRMPKASKELLEAMGKLTFLQGSWEGEGWRQLGQAKQTFKEQVSVQEKIGGAFLLLDAKSIVTDAGGLPPVLTASVIAYDEASRSYKAKALAPDGRIVDMEASLPAEQTFQWGFVTPGGEMRYRIRRSGDEWRETVERRDGQQGWITVSELTMKKV